MLLTIDTGNTNTVLGVFDGDQLVRSWRIKSDARTTADELWLMFRGLLADHPITGISAGLMLSSRTRFAPASMTARAWATVSASTSSARSG